MSSHGANRLVLLISMILFTHDMKGKFHIRARFRLVCIDHKRVLVSLGIHQSQRKCRNNIHTQENSIILTVEIEMF